MPTFSEFFGLGRSQGELDFVDVDLDKDTPLFVDPFALSQRVDRWSQDAHACLRAFFDELLECLQAGSVDRVQHLMSFLKEPNETRLGLSRGRPQGAGIGEGQAEQIVDALTRSTAIKTGFINSLEECELMIEGIGWDKISDLTTNVIRGDLASYTGDQCGLHGIPTQSVACGAVFSMQLRDWVSDYLSLPVVADSPVLLVPKAIARAKASYDHRHFYRHFALSFLQATHLSAGTSLVRALKNGKRVVYKKDLEARHPCTKRFVAEFARENPRVLHEYRATLEQIEKKGRNSETTVQEEADLAAALIAVLESIPGGPADAERYHRAMIGVLELLFFPDLVNPRKEREIHQGRKRIDISMENGARFGPFESLHAVKHVPCAFIAFECKNYTREVGNPELDQIAGRFSPNRGKVGFVCCRVIQDRAKFVERCRDTYRDDRGVIVYMDDDRVVSWLRYVVSGEKSKLAESINESINEVILA